MNIEFDPAKAASNLTKHGVSFEEAKTVLLDPQSLVREDEDAQDEQRWVMVGMSAAGRLLVVVHTMRGETVRLISARKATRKEANSYA